MLARLNEAAKRLGSNGQGQIYTRPLLALLRLHSEAEVTMPADSQQLRLCHSVLRRRALLLSGSPDPAEAGVLESIKVMNSEDASGKTI